MASQAAQHSQTSEYITAVIGTAVLLLLIALVVTQITWYFHNDRQLTQAAEASTEYNACLSFFEEHIHLNYHTATQKQCRELLKWQVQQTRQYFTHQNHLRPVEKYQTPHARRQHILNNRKRLADFDAIQNSGWLP